MLGRGIVGGWVSVVVFFAACSVDHDPGKDGNEAGSAARATGGGAADAGAGDTAGQPHGGTGGATVDMDVPDAGGGGADAGGGGADAGSSGAEPGALCPPGAIWCDGKSFYSCDAERHAVHVTDCTDQQTCDVSKNGCTPQMCMPGALSCIDGIQPGVCAANGASIERVGEDCQAAGKGCWEGVCSAKVCTPGTTMCADQSNLQSCNAAGTGFVTRSCFDIVPFGCFDLGDHSRCVDLECASEQMFCVENSVFHCSARLGPFSLVKNCGTEACLNGACVPKICEPFRYFCRDGDIHQCDSQGGSDEAVAMTCPADAPCELEGNGPRCGPPP